MEVTVEFIRQNIIWVGLASVSGTMLLSSMLRARTGPNAVSPLSATLMINREDAWVLDVRDEAAFSTGHIPGARHVPAEKLSDRISELEKFKKKPAIVYCERGAAVRAACDTLKRAGFEKVFSLAGGLSAWEEANQPITRK
ncbi:MAG: hypothetical protein RIR70_1715 [Pseudomonadota bacterium]